MIYTGTKISLRQIERSDVTAQYLQWLTDPSVNQFLETRWDPQTMESIRDFVDRMVSSPDNRLLAIIENYTSQHIGNLKIGPINRHHNYADLSYFIGAKEYWNNGFATEAIKAAIAYAFDELGLYSLRAGVYADNLGSRKVLEKCGMTYRGEYPGELVSNSGRQAHQIFSVTKPQWAELCAPHSN